MKNGICKMCFGQKDLIRSHLIPRAAYELCRSADSEPIKITAEVVMQTSRQTQDHLLCSECDNLLSSRGESWVLPKLQTFNQGFPLYDLLVRVPPDVTVGVGAGYATCRNPAIDVQAITHFAIGIFWTASVHSWTKHGREPRIDLGPYQEQLRLFLFGEGSFPKYVSLVVGVALPQTQFINATEPYRGGKAGGRNYIFNVPRMQFVMTVGKTITPDFVETCFYRNPLHPIIVTDLAKSMMAIFRRHSAKAHRSKKLVEYLAAMKKRPPESLG
jgi:hypothetical protein